MSPIEISPYLIGLRKVESIYNRVAQLSHYVYGEHQLDRREEYLEELEFLLKGVKGTDSHLTIFNHKTYSPELEVGHMEFWGPLPEGTSNERMISILGLLHPDYASFPYESVDWFTKALQKIPTQDRANMKIHHSNMKFMRTDNRPIRIFSQGMPLQSDEQNNFTITLNYVQNIHHLIKKNILITGFAFLMVLKINLYKHSILKQKIRQDMICCPPGKKTY